MMQVEQIANNQIVVIDGDGKHFFSYGTLIGFLDNSHNLSLTKDWDYSRTTLKYLREAFYLLKNKSKKDIEKMLESGELNYWRGE